MLLKNQSKVDTFIMNNNTYKYTHTQPTHTHKNYQKKAPKSPQRLPTGMRKYYNSIEIKMAKSLFTHTHTYIVLLHLHNKAQQAYILGGQDFDLN